MENIEGLNSQDINWQRESAILSFQAAVYGTYVASALLPVSIIN
jgi:hypothetical protein